MQLAERELITGKVIEAMEQLRPFLQSDGGDIELVEITDDVIVKVRFIGACSECSMSSMTLKAGLVDVLKSAIPQLGGVQTV
jgi:Fe-S cluster biogenesis protein NfuA